MRRSTRTLARSVLVGSGLVVALTARLAPAQDQTPHAQAEAAAQEEWTLTRLEIEPQETRPQLIKALRMLRNKTRPGPTRRHGNIPL